jgi:hypothetical protein
MFCVGCFGFVVLFRIVLFFQFFYFLNDSKTKSTNYLAKTNRTSKSKRVRKGEKG